MRSVKFLYNVGSSVIGLQFETEMPVCGFGMSIVYPFPVFWYMV